MPRLIVLLLGVTVCLAASEKWIVQDDLGDGADYIHRIEALEGSVKRAGPWATFAQRLTIKRPGDSNVLREERTVAVNCLTGAWDSIKSRTYETRIGGKATYSVDRTLRDVERLAVLRESPSAISEGLGARTFRFACSCAADGRPSVSVKFPEPDIRAVYERFVFEQRKRRQYRVAYIRVDSAAEAREVIAKLNRGEDFAFLVETHSSARHEPSGGDPGFHDEGRWSGKTRAILESLEPGGHSLTPEEGPLGWDVYKLIEVREIPAPSLKNSRADIVAYLQRDLTCGVTPPK